MLSREYALFIGFVFIIMAIGGYVSSSFLGADGLSALVPTIWLLTGLVALGIGFASKDVNTLRWFSGLVGVVYLLWGAIALFTTNSLQGFLSMIQVGIGAMGLAAALAPAQWVRESETYSPQRT